MVRLKIQEVASKIYCGRNALVAGKEPLEPVSFVAAAVEEIVVASLLAAAVPFLSIPLVLFAFPQTGRIPSHLLCQR